MNPLLNLPTNELNKKKAAEATLIYNSSSTLWFKNILYASSEGYAKKNFKKLEG